MSKLPHVLFAVLSCVACSRVPVPDLSPERVGDRLLTNSEEDCRRWSGEWVHSLGGDGHICLLRLADENICREVGGDWNSTRSKCVVEYPDAGESCEDSSECVGECLIDFTQVCSGALENEWQCTSATPYPKVGDIMEGTCQRYSSVGGTLYIVRDGQVQSPVYVN
jgi:hypothetical protein